MSQAFCSLFVHKRSVGFSGPPSRLALLLKGQRQVRGLGIRRLAVEGATIGSRSRRNLACPSAASIACWGRQRKQPVLRSYEERGPRLGPILGVSSAETDVVQLAPNQQRRNPLLALLALCFERRSYCAREKISASISWPPATDDARQTPLGCLQHARRPRTYKCLVSYARKNCVHESWSHQSDRHEIVCLPKRTCNHRLLAVAP
jgi:hypothetical protein